MRLFLILGLLATFACGSEPAPAEAALTSSEADLSLRRVSKKERIQQRKDAREAKRQERIERRLCKAQCREQRKPKAQRCDDGSRIRATCVKGEERCAWAFAEVCEEPAECTPYECGEAPAECNEQETGGPVCARDEYGQCVWSDDECEPLCDTAIRCAPGFQSTDTDGDGCDDNCEPICEPILCREGDEPVDTNEDGCDDSCQTVCDTAIRCAPGFQSVDTDGDGCDDNCEPICEPILCREGDEPVDTTGDGCFDTCQNVCTFAIRCAPGFQAVDTDGDGCDDNCEPICEEILCREGDEPVDTDGDGCDDSCQPIVCDTAIRCAPGFEPVDTDGDGCDDNCVPTLGGPGDSCGGFLGLQCQEGLNCVDVADDGCDPQNGGADCPGVCEGTSSCGLDIEPRESLYESNRTLLGTITLEETLNRIALNSGLTGGDRARFEILSAAGDSVDPIIPAGETAGPSCDDGNNLLNPDFDFACPRVEENHNSNVDDASTWKAIAAVNRIDLAANDGSHCGEQRMIFASNTGRRAFIIFEAQIPNPGTDISGCLPLANFWANLTGQSVAFRTAALEEAFILGNVELNAAGFAPFLSQANLTHGTGQARVNFFDQFPWNLREYKLVDRGGVIGAELAPTAAHIFSQFFDDDFIANAPNGAACKQAILDSVPNFFGDNINTMSWEIPQDCLANESPNVFSHNYESVLSQGGPQLAAEIQTIIDSDPSVAGALTADDVAKRMNLTQNCMACHVQGASQLGNGLVVSGPPGFVHTEENGAENCLPSDTVADCFPISNLLKNDFLPHREEVLEAFLCSGEEEEDALQGAPAARATHDAPAGLLGGKSAHGAN